MEKTMRHRQRGITFIGWLFLLIPLAIVGYAGIRLTPLYLNYMRVAHSLQQIGQDERSDNSAQSIRNAILRRFDIETINYPEAKDIDVRRDGSGWVIEAKYDDSVPLFANLSLQISFDKVVQIGGIGGG
jgi:Domain of unknown function (DUF4845)